MSSITVRTIIHKPISTVWEFWNTPAHIKNWAFASDDWGVGDVENDLRTGGRFKTFMMAKDGSAGFDFTGTYTAVEEPTHIAYTMDGDDARKVDIRFEDMGDSTQVTETFDTESENSEEMQRGGWQAILDNFKKYAERQV